MVIEYLNANMLADPIQLATVADIAGVVETDDEGTDMDNVRDLNKDRRVVAATPSIEFDARKIQRDIREAMEDLNPQHRLPAIAWLILGEGYDERCHAVCLTEIKRETDEITYIDPWYGQKTENLVPFSHEWEKADRWLVEAWA
jgi:hypothetical protein